MNLKNNKGSITLYILVSLLFFIIAIVNVQAYLKTKESGVESEYQKIKASYEKDASEVYTRLNSNKSITIGSLKESGKAVQGKTILKDDTGDQIVIPKGFKIKSDSPILVDRGIVVVAPDNSEFVWVPVPDVIYDGTTEIKVGEYTPMARLQTGTTNYQGVLYDLDQEQGSQTVYDLDTYSVGTTNYREPSLITGNNADTYADMETVTGESCDNGTDSTTNEKYYELAGYSSIQEFGKDMQDEYNNMVKSVDKYKGFYVGKYETGIENGKAVSKNAYKNSNVITADGSQDETKYWYGLYNKQRNMAKDNNLIGVQSSMIWGSQYDAMMNWMIKNDNIVGTGYASSKINKGIITGQSENDIIKNIYDLYGCHYEWTLEAKGESCRVLRGGMFNVEFSPSNRNGTSTPNVVLYSNMMGSRLTLYLNDPMEVH